MGILTNPQIQNKKNQKGSILLYSLIISMIVLSIGLSIAQIVLTEIKASGDATSSHQAYLAAETGMEEAALHLKSGGGSPGTVVDLGGGRKYYYTIEHKKKWTKADSISSGFDNVSNMTGGEYSQALAVDSKGNPHVAWYQVNGAEKNIYYKKWDSVSGSWVSIKGDTVSYLVAICLTNDASNLPNFACGGDEMAVSISLVLDSSDFPHIAWMGRRGKFVTPHYSSIKYTKWDGGKWAKAGGGTGCYTGAETYGCDTLDIDSRYSISPKILMGSDNVPQVIWRDAKSASAVGYEYFYSKYISGIGWVKSNGVILGSDILSISTGIGSDYFAVLDTNNRPNFVFEEASQACDGCVTTYGLFFTKFNGTNWVKADNVTVGKDNVSAPLGNASYFRNFYLFLQGDIPHIVWTKDSSLYYRKWNSSTNNWTKANGDIACDEISGGVTPYIVTRPVIAVGGDGIPHVVFAGEERITYRKWAPLANAWRGANEISTYDTLSSSYYETSPCQVDVRVDSSNRPSVFFVHEELFGAGVLARMYFSTWNGNKWVKADGTTDGPEVVFSGLRSGSPLENTFNLTTDKTGDYHLAFTSSAVIYSRLVNEGTKIIVKGEFNQVQRSVEFTL